MSLFSSRITTGSPWVLLSRFQHSRSRGGPEGGKCQDYSQQSQVSISLATVFYTSSWGGAHLHSHTRTVHLPEEHTLSSCTEFLWALHRQAASRYHTEANLMKLEHAAQSHTHSPCRQLTCHLLATPANCRVSSERFEDYPRGTMAGTQSLPTPLVAQVEQRTSSYRKCQKVTQDPKILHHVSRANQDYKTRCNSSLHGEGESLQQAGSLSPRALGSPHSGKLRVNTCKSHHRLQDGLPLQSAGVQGLLSQV